MEVQAKMLQSVQSAVEDLAFQTMQALQAFTAQQSRTIPLKDLFYPPRTFSVSVPPEAITVSTETISGLGNTPKIEIPPTARSLLGGGVGRSPASAKRAGPPRT
jgi:hypothetical protein